MIQLFIKRLWHSPTVTSWGNKIAASARLFLVLPLLLSRFDEVELAAWFLFGSILFFSSLVSTQTSLVLSRMVSVAMGGAHDLGIISASRRGETSGEANWTLVERLYGSMGWINLANSLLGVVVALLLGWFSLSAVLEGYPDADSIWIAFLLFLLGQFLVQAFSRYALTLRGLNQVSLTNRWEALFALLSAIAGGITLWLGGGVIQLAIVMQAFLLLGAFRQWALLMYVVEPRFRSISAWRVDRQIWSWIWVPLWRSFIRAVANRGSSKVAAVVLARHADPSLLTSLLLSLRLLDTLEDVAVTPMASHVPRFGRLLAGGDIKTFRSGVFRALKLSSFIQITGIIAIGYMAHFGLDLINSDTEFLSQSVFLTLALGHLLASQVRQSLMISVIGNNIIAVGRLTIAAVVSAAMSIVLIPLWPVAGFIVSAYLPIILILNINPVRCGCELMNVGVFAFIREIVILPWLFVVSALLLSFFVPWENWSNQLAEIIKVSL